MNQLTFITLMVVAFVGLSMIFRRIKDAYEETGP